MTLTGHELPTPAEQPFYLCQHLEDTSVVVGVYGEVDLCSAAQLHSRLDAALDTAAGIGGRVVVDLRRVTFLGAAGLSVLAETLQRAEATGTLLRIVADDACPAARVLPIAHLDHTLTPGACR